MGMDVYGKKPKTEKGNYFRNNVWWWHPLWDYCCYVNKTLDQLVPHGHSNSGDGLDDVAARQLGFNLLESIKQGVAEAYITAFNQNKEELPLDPCFCTKPTYNFQTGERGEAQQQPSQTCKVCNGEGLMKPWNANYFIDEENIREFAEFCIDSGGFEIL